MNVDLIDSENLEPAGAVKKFIKSNTGVIGERTPLKDCTQRFPMRTVSVGCGDLKENTPKRLSEKKNSLKVFVDTKDVGIQADNITPEDLVSEEASRAYWKKLCENRERWLEEAYDERFELRREKRKMKALVEACERMMKILEPFIMSEEDTGSCDEASEAAREGRKKTEHDSSTMSEAYFSGDE